MIAGNAEFESRTRQPQMPEEVLKNVKKKQFVETHSSQFPL